MDEWRELGDFTTTGRVVPMAAIAVTIGLLASLVALALLRLIGLFTNLCFFQRWDFALVSPAGHHLGPLVVVVPVAGGLVIGLMARYGSERIRGHGIPEAIESILIGGSRVQPRVAILKPVSAAISIGTGGPFGAEGPARRGYHLSREYATDPLEILFVREVMRSKVAAIAEAPSRDALAALLDGRGDGRRQRLYPVIGADGAVLGVVRRRRLRELLAATPERGPLCLDEAVECRPVVAHPDEPLRQVAYRMAETGLTPLPVVDRGDPPRLVGMIGLTDLLQARMRNLEAERRRERFLPLRVMRPSPRGR